MDCRTNEMIKLREQGLSYRAIGEIYGISKQAVQQQIGERSRKCSVELEKFVYEGFYDLFKNDKKMTFVKLAKILHGREIDKHLHNTEVIMREFIYGNRDSVKLKTTHINNLLDYTGKTYEEMFRKRRGAGK